MKFIVDASTGSGVANWLKTNGLEVYDVYLETPFWPDKTILKKAFDENWVVITNDKDFGDLIFRDRLPHRGIILLRIKDETPPNKIRLLAHLLDHFDETQILDHFLVLTERGVRIS